MKYYLEKGQCHANCDKFIGTYESVVEEEGICKDCGAHCDYCKDNTQCKVCRKVKEVQYFEKEGECTADCGDLYYHHIDQKEHKAICIRCPDVNMLSCRQNPKEPKEIVGLECRNKFLLIEGKCVKTCPDGWTQGK